MSNSTRLKKIVTVAIMIAVEVILHRLLSIKTPIVMLHLGFLPVAVTAIAFGPLWAGAVGALSELIGALLFPTGGYFPGFTVTALITGILYGIFLYKTRYSFANVCICSAIIGVALTLFLNTFWIYAFFNDVGEGFWVLMAARLVKAVISFVLEIILIPLLHKAFIKQRIIE